MARIGQGEEPPPAREVGPECFERDIVAWAVAGVGHDHEWPVAYSPRDRAGEVLDQRERCLVAGCGQAADDDGAVKVDAGEDLAVGGHRLSCGGAAEGVAENPGPGQVQGPG